MTPDPVTTALSALRELARAADAEEESWPALRDDMRDACRPSLIAALCDVALKSARATELRVTLRQTGTMYADDELIEEVGKSHDAAVTAHAHLAAVIKETGNG